MDPGNGFKTLDALVLAFEGAHIFESIAGDDLDRSINPKRRTGQTHDTVAS
jgi:hypothetical protein